MKYKLFGVVYHHGPTVSSGHYTTAVLSQSFAGGTTGLPANQWLHIDDESVSPVTEAEVCISESAAREGRAGEIGGRERCAYLLFYERIQ